MDNNTLMTVLFVVGMLAVFLFFFILPQQKQKSRESSFLQSLKIGDKVVSIGGIHGIVVDMNESQVVLQMEDGSSQLLLEKQAISAEATTHVYNSPPANEKIKKK